MTKRPQPLLSRAGIVSAISGLAALAASLGLIPSTLGDEISTESQVILGAGFTIAAAIPALIHAVVSRNAVTPIAAPQDAAGNKLVPVTPLVVPSDDSTPLSL